MSETGSAVDGMTLSRSVFRDMHQAVLPFLFGDYTYTTLVATFAGGCGWGGGLGVGRWGWGGGEALSYTLSEEV